MKRACPTITELLAFDALARQGSLTQAARELCITVSAVSKQLASLEEFLGQSLVIKVGRGIELTTLGRIYWQRTAPSLRALETASFEARANDQSNGLLTLASVPTFLTKWLIPRLPNFRKRSPGTTLSFSQHLNANDGIPQGVDAAIRYGSGQWPNTRADYIAGREFVVVYSPMLFRSQRRTKGGLDLGRHTLLHHEQAAQAWPHWAASQNVNPLQVLAGPRFAQYSALIQAAVSGLGVGLVPLVLVLDELKQGLLLTGVHGGTQGSAQSSALASAQAPLMLDQGHYLCYAEDRLNLPIFADFRDWILAEGRR